MNPSILATALVTAEALGNFAKGFTDIVSANLPILLPVAGTFFGISWVLRRINKAKRGSL